MCTLAILVRPDDPDWPLILAGNRDERLGRGWDAPAAWWPAQPGVVGGRDREAGGTWFAVGRRGAQARPMVASVLNRVDSLGPAPDKHSRGVLPLLALEQPTAEAAATAIAALPVRDWRPFNLLVADAAGAFVVMADGVQARCARLAPGLSLLAGVDVNDASASSRIGHFRPLFAAAAPPDPARGAWSAWEALLSRVEGQPQAGPFGAMFVSFGDYGTSSSACVALPGKAAAHGPVYRFRAHRGTDPAVVARGWHDISWPAAAGGL